MQISVASFNFFQYHTSPDDPQVYNPNLHIWNHTTLFLSKRNSCQLLNVSIRFTFVQWLFALSLSPVFFLASPIYLLFKLLASAIMAIEADKPGYIACLPSSGSGMTLSLLPLSIPLTTSSSQMSNTPMLQTLTLCKSQRV